MNNFLEVATKAAHDAGGILKEGFIQNRGKGVEFTRKEDRSLVTDFDRRAEEKVIQVIRSQFSDHAILAEESGGEIGDGYTWLIDPLDGTTNFVMENPLFSAVVTLRLGSEVILAVVFCPMLDRLYTAEKGVDGAYLNGKPIHVSSTESLRDATCGISGGRSKDAIEQFCRVASSFRRNGRTVRVFGSVAFEICQVAAGHSDAHFYGSGSLWDGLGPAFIAQKAGGKVTNENGSLLITNGKIHEEALRVLGGSI